MKKLLRFMGESIPSDPHLWIAFAGAGLVTLFELLGLLHGYSFDKSKVILLIIMIAILSLTGDRLKHSKARSDSERQLTRLTEATFDRRITFRRRPSKRDDYIYLWGNFTGRYCAYSPSYQVEETTGDDEILDMFVRRYQDHDFDRADYLFLTKDERGKADLKNLRTLMHRVEKALPACAAKIKVKENADENAAESAEIYIGCRESLPTAIVELRDPALGSSHGNPHFYAVINDREVIENYLQNFFDEQWKKATHVELFS